MDKPALVRRLLPIQNRMLNPLVRAALSIGLCPPTYALLETTGRRSGRAVRVPVANGLDGDTFWLISALGRHGNYVRNIQAHPRVRIKVRPPLLRDGTRMRWRTGTARLMPEDNPRDRQRQLSRRRPGYRADAVLLRALATDLLTIRIDLDAATLTR